MKLVKVVAIMALMTSTIQAMASDATDKLVARMQSERKSLVNEIVETWLHYGDNPKLPDLVARLVDLDVRLNAFNADNVNESLLTSVEIAESSTPKDLAGAIAREYFKRDGLNVNTRDSFNGVYLVYPETTKKRSRDKK